MKFKAGDRIKIKDSDRYNDWKRHEGEIAKLTTNGETTGNWNCLWPNGDMSGSLTNDNMILVERTKEMADIQKVVGGQYRLVKDGTWKQGTIVYFAMDDGSNCPLFSLNKACAGEATGAGHCSDCAYEDWDYLEFIDEGEKPMARRTFRQLKETVDSKKGCVWQEACDDGDQEYAVITPELVKGEDKDITYSDHSLVQDQPEWFVEVFQVEPQYMTTIELAQFEEFKKKITVRAKVSVGGKKPLSTSKRKSAWTPERRAAQAKRMKAARAAKLAAQG